jgi:hypothetical protein
VTYGIPEFPTHKYFGSFLDTGNPRALPSGQTNGKSSVMTISVCINQCRLASFIFSGVEYGQECWCGNSLPEIPGLNCNLPCYGNSSQVIISDF